MRRSWFPITALVFAAAACSSSGSKPAATAAPAPAPAATVATTTTTAAVARLASYDVATKEETYVDTSRATAPNHTFKGAPTRTIRVRYYYPTEHQGAPFPMIVFSHGWTASPEIYQNLLKPFARAGYVVVAPAYPLSNTNAPGGPIVTDLGNQPKDASFVIDRVLAENAGRGWLHGLVDPNRIGADGHSLGAFTTFGLVYNSTCGDERIKASVEMSGIAGGCPGQYFTGRNVPLLGIQGDHDELVPYGGGHDSWSKASSPKFFLTILGGKHVTEELGGTSVGQQIVIKATIAFFDRYLRDDDAALARLTNVATHAGVTKFETRP